MSYLAPEGDRVAAIAVEHLSKRYGEVDAVNDVSFEVEQGEVFALLGPNGAGKTTTIEILEGFRNRDRGRVDVLGYDPADPATSRQLRERLGWSSRSWPSSPSSRCARPSPAMPATTRPRPVDEVLELVGLEEKADARVKTLSGGQQRRLDLGLGIIGNPELLVLDEPTTGFDPTARRERLGPDPGHDRWGSTVILTTHYMDEAEALADRVAVINAGRIIAEGTPDSLGGRDVGEATIRFRLPAGTGVGICPSPPRSRRTVPWRSRPTDEIEVLARLTNWALAEKSTCRAHRGAVDPRGRLPAAHGLRADAEAGADAQGPDDRARWRGQPRVRASRRRPGRFEGPTTFTGGPAGLLRAAGILAEPDRSDLHRRFLRRLPRAVSLDARAHRGSRHLPARQVVVYYVPSFAAYGIMSACFNHVDDLRR